MSTFWVLHIIFMSLYNHKNVTSNYTFHIFTIFNTTYT